MHNIFYILKRDIKRILSNRVAILIVLGICMLPYLYAWFNGRLLCRILISEYQQTIRSFNSVYSVGSGTIKSTEKLTGSIDSNLKFIDKTLADNGRLLDNLETDVTDAEALIRMNEFIHERLEDTKLM